MGDNTRVKLMDLTGHLEIYLILIHFIFSDQKFDEILRENDAEGIMKEHMRDFIYYSAVTEK
jgi:hypothetical protein